MAELITPSSVILMLAFILLALAEIVHQLWKINKKLKSKEYNGIELDGEILKKTQGNEK